MQCYTPNSVACNIRPQLVRKYMAFASDYFGVGYKVMFYIITRGPISNLQVCLVRHAICIGPAFIFMYFLNQLV